MTTPADPPGPRRQRVAVYGVGLDDENRVLLTRASTRTGIGGRWFLPGGGVEFGEAPVEALVREVTEETGLEVDVGRLLGVLSDVVVLADGTGLHSVRLVYALDAWRGTLRPEIGGSSDAARWVPRTELATQPVLPYVRRAIGLAGSGPPPRPGRPSSP
ncbi:MAG TPA: NUDIX domain-containing protein [Acidimicrobiales bacterium]|nr:NUDIX domain-containing protein [Acidimicrobiales bacterium]